MSGLARRAVVDPAAVVPPIPAPLPAWAKALIWIAETVATGILINQFDSGTTMSPTGTQADDPSADTWRRFQVRCQDQTSQDTADDQIFTMDIVNITNGSIDNTWTEADYNLCATRIVDIVDGITPSMNTRYTVTEVAAYIMAFRGYGDPKPFAISGPPEAVMVLNRPGSSALASVPQNCSTVTELTPVRKHWGRFYTFSLTAGVIDPAGRFTNVFASALAQRVHDNYDGLMDAEFFPVVPVTKVDKAPFRALQTVTGVKVDNVVDIQRRRRHRSSTFQSELPLPAAAATQPSLPAE